MLVKRVLGRRAFVASCAATRELLADARRKIRIRVEKARKQEREASKLVGERVVGMGKCIQRCYARAS